MRAATLATALVLSSLSASLTSVDSLAAQAPEVELSDIGFEGNFAFPEDSLSRAIFNRETKCRSWLLKVPIPFCWFGAGFAVDRQVLIARELPGDMLRLRSFYSRRGFREAQVDTVIGRLTDEGVSILFQIEEGRPVRVSTLSILGMEGLEDLDVAAALPIAEGDLLSSIDLDAARDSLILRLQNRGYPRADVMRTSLVPSGTPYEAHVTFEVDAGPHTVFGPVTFVGNRELSEGVVRRMLPFREGQEYSQVRRLEAQRNLYSIEMVQNVTIEEAVDPAGSVPDTVLPLQVTVTEGSVHRVRTGVGWSTSDCVNTEGRWTSRNFMGGARRLQVRARLSNMASEALQDGLCTQAGVGDFGGLNWLVSAEFSQPWIFNQQYALGASLFHERQSLNDVFVRQAVGLDLSLSRTVGPYTSLSFAYRPQLTQLEAAEVFFCTTFLVCTPEDISGIQDPNWLAPLAANVVRNRTNSLLNPTQGYQVVFSAEYASSITGSDFDYNRLFASLAGYQDTSRGQVFAVRVQAGWVGAGPFSLMSGAADIIHPQKRFYSGGANSVRGFAQNQLGPRVLTVDVDRLLAARSGTVGPTCFPMEIIDLTCDASALDDATFETPRPTGGRLVVEGGIEYRLPVGTRVEAAVFADFGRVWAEAESGVVSEFEVAPGVGIRYLSPIGPIRVDLGYRFRGVENLSVVTSQIRAFDPDRDADGDKIQRIVDPSTGATETIEFVLVDELAVLGLPVGFGTADGFSLSRFQLHLSIGQAF
jgi:outer membrane protein assembly factor BamA